jgi:hypothetical protein
MTEGDYSGTSSTTGVRTGTSSTSTNASTGTSSSTNTSTSTSNSNGVSVVTDDRKNKEICSIFNEMIEFYKLRGMTADEHRSLSCSRCVNVLQTCCIHMYICVNVYVYIHIYVYICLAI